QSLHLERQFHPLRGFDLSRERRTCVSPPTVTTIVLTGRTVSGRGGTCREHPTPSRMIVQANGPPRSSPWGWKLLKLMAAYSRGLSVETRQAMSRNPDAQVMECPFNELDPAPLAAPEGALQLRAAFVTTCPSALILWQRRRPAPLHAFDHLNLL